MARLSSDFVADLARQLDRLNAAGRAWERRDIREHIGRMLDEETLRAVVERLTACGPRPVELADLEATLRAAADVVARFGSQVPEAARVFAVIALTGAIERTGNMSFTLQDGFETDLSATFADAEGNPASVEGASWSSSDEAVVEITDNGDGTAVAVGASPGTAVISLSADARFGPETVLIDATLDIEVVAGEASTATIVPSEPRPVGSPAPTPEAPPVG